MLRKLSPCQSGIAGRAHLRYKIVLVAVAILLTAAVAVGGRDGSKDWTVLKNCHLIVNPANDGDSFHVSVGSNEECSPAAIHSCDIAPTPERTALKTKVVSLI
jgi:hypothetical protein